jgi:hypothetical protein
MEPSTVALLAGAGFLGGIMNALAGGASLVTFPALLTAGLPPLIANASNAVAVIPGHGIAAYSDRSILPPTSALLGGVAVATACGLAGALVLTATSERLFTLLVPGLIALATATFAFGPALNARIAAGAKIANARNMLVGAVSVYGGYFGAGLGVMLLAVLSLTGDEPLRKLNAIKNVLATANAVASVAILSVSGFVRWPETIVMMTFALLGGLAGARLGAVLPARVLRRIIVGLGVVMTFLFAQRYWLS